MQIINQTVSSTLSGIDVKFIGEGGETISVHFAQTGGGAIADDEAIEKAKSVMVQVATFGQDFSNDPVEEDSRDIAEQVEGSTSRTFSPID
jgi:hypothetical protein